MEIYLAGFNVDFSNIEIIERLKKEKDIKKSNKKDGAILEELSDMEWTPETISASYARISRDPQPIYKLREKARNEIEKSRKSNENIIFEMGHASIAEHAVFNFDIIDISRLAVEELETTRLASFTEKSQRYIKIENAYFIPKYFKDNKDEKNKYINLMNELFEGYDYLLNKLQTYFLRKNKNVKQGTKEYRNIINLAKEDARYLLPLSTYTQLGLTVNGRSLENIIRKLNASTYDESNTISKMLYDIVKKYSPSLVKYIEASNYEKNIYNSIKKEIDSIDKILPESPTEDVSLVSFEDNLYNKIIIAILIKTSSLNFNQAVTIVEEWTDEKKLSVLDLSIKDLEFFDSVIREYEIGDFIFNISLSSSAFAQLKRHRMTTQIIGGYSTSLGVTIPHSIKEIDEEEYFMNKINKINMFYNELFTKIGKTANYLLTNAHKRNVLFKCNMRELIHIARLRADSHAQWDIRELTNKMIKLVIAQYPFFKKVLVGKDKF